MYKNKTRIPDIKGTSAEKCIDIPAYEELPLRNMHKKEERVKSGA